MKIKNENATMSLVIKDKIVLPIMEIDISDISDMNLTCSDKYLEGSDYMDYIFEKEYDKNCEIEIYRKGRLFERYKCSVENDCADSYAFGDNNNILMFYLEMDNKIRDEFLEQLILEIKRVKK